MKQYYAFGAKQGDLDTFEIMPLESNTPFMHGKFFPSSGTLVLISPLQREVFDLIEKFKDDGSFEISAKSGKPKVERIRMQNNVDYQLKGNDIGFFIHNFVENAQFALEIVNKYKLTNIVQTPLIVAPDAATTENIKN